MQSMPRLDTRQPQRVAPGDRERCLLHSSQLPASDVNVCAACNRSCYGAIERVAPLPPFIHVYPYVPETHLCNI
jgi:hypothetical protein